MKIFVLYSSRSVQPMGLFSEIGNAVEFMLSKGVTGNVAEYEINTPLLEYSSKFGSVGSSGNLNKPEFVECFSSAYVLVLQAWMEDGEVLVTDWRNGRTTKLIEWVDAGGTLQN